MKGFLWFLAAVVLAFVVSFVFMVVIPGRL
jgi:hypothetical protein